MHRLAKKLQVDRLGAYIAGYEPVAVARTCRVGVVTAQGVPSGFGRNHRNFDVDAITALRELLRRRGSVTPSILETVLEV